MFRLHRKPPWYAAGLAFECVECGRCCAGPEEGYVWVTDEEINAIAARLGITPTEMRRKYVRKVGRRRSLVEREDNHDCVFLRRNRDGGNHCAVYEARPSQCRTWPFWPSNLQDPTSWSVASGRCRGINRGPLHSWDEIEQKCRDTES